MNTISKMILTLLFDSYVISLVVFRGLFILGAWKLLEKSGLKPWWALIPWVREYQLARCGNREEEGRVYSVTSCLITVLSLANILLRASRGNRDLMSLSPLFMVFLVAVMIIHIIYNMRIFTGLIEVYGVSKLWLPLSVIDETRFIPVLVWGFGSKYQPGWTIGDLEAEMDRLATQGSTEYLEEGLVVNIKDRTIREFLHRKMLLRDIHMSIPSGHLVLLLGGSGAGKTTYLNAVTGYEKANAEVFLSGKDMYKEYKKMQYNVGFVPQSDMLRGKDTVENTLADAARLRLPINIPVKDRRKRVSQVMEVFGLTPVKDSKAEKLSGGQRKRLSVSMEYLSNPSLFILDEPDSGLDGVMAKELFLRLREIADSGKIVIVISHTPDRVIDLIDDVIVLAKDSTQTGRLAFYGSIPDAREFFGVSRMEEIVKTINPKEEGGEGRADEFVLKYAEVANG